MCPGCGLRLDRGEPDYWLGALLFNLIAAELLFAAGVLAVLLWTWPQPPWDVLQWGGIPVLVAFPILTYPITKLLWLTFDLIFRPPTAGRLRPAGRRKAPSSDPVTRSLRRCVGTGGAPAPRGTVSTTERRYRLSEDAAGGAPWVLRRFALPTSAVCAARQPGR
jgi:hypothetical protein